ISNVAQNVSVEQNQDLFAGQITSNLLPPAIVRSLDQALIEREQAGGIVSSQQLENELLQNENFVAELTSPWANVGQWLDLPANTGTPTPESPPALANS